MFDAFIILSQAHVFFDLYIELFRGKVIYQKLNVLSKRLIAISTVHVLVVGIVTFLVGVALVFSPGEQVFSQRADFTLNILSSCRLEAFELRCVVQLWHLRELVQHLEITKFPYQIKI